MKQAGPPQRPDAPKGAAVLLGMIEAPPALRERPTQARRLSDPAGLWPRSNRDAVLLRMRETGEGASPGLWEFLIEPGGTSGVLRRGVSEPGGSAVEDLRFTVAEGGERWIMLNIARGAPHERSMILRFGGADEGGRVATLLAWRGKVRGGVLERAALQVGTRAPASRGRGNQA